MDFPPSKRHRGSHNEDPAGTDVFGDEEDFTQDDLEEIDIIASQAFTRDVQATSSKRSFASISVYPEQNKEPKKEGRKTFAIGNSHPSSSPYNNMEPKRNDTAGNAQNRDELYYSHLEAQQAELKRKLKEVEEQILMKNGEIRVLRDSLRLANQEKEQQKQAYLELEKEKAHIQSEKEKELSKKFESLKSELHFKQAEMNEMRNKLQSSERGAKIVGTPVRNSGNSPGSRAFVTKESFSAELPVKPSVAKSQHVEGEKQIHGKSDKEHASPATRDTDEIHHKGPVLLNLLLQHPLEPSSLGLCHLLCISPDALPAIFTQLDYTSPTSSVSSSTSSTDTRVLHQPRVYFHQYQSQAMSGLARLTHCPSTQLFRRSCPSAVHLLPLLHYHISLYCQTLETIDRSGKSPLQAAALSGGSDSSSATTVEESLGAQEEFALAAMKALYHIVCESGEAVNSVLSDQGGKDSKKSSEHRCSQPQSAGHSSTADKACDELQSHSLLLQKLFQLVDLKFVSNACHREAVVNCSLRILCALAERAEECQLWRFQVVLASQAVTQNVSLDSPYSTVCLFVRFLALLVDCDKIAHKLCSHNYVCPFVQFFLYVTSRPNKVVTEDMWSRLEVEWVGYIRQQVDILSSKLVLEAGKMGERKNMSEFDKGQIVTSRRLGQNISKTAALVGCSWSAVVVRLLSKLFTQKTSTWTAFSAECNCPCSSEVVRTVVVVLHRQWLSIKNQEKHVGGVQTWTSSGVHSLRETLMLLHWLLLNDSSFSMHCLDVLHMYHQIIPAIRDTLRRIPDLSECEELAIEDLCRPEAEEVEDMDIDAAS
ncbi:ATR-interacting protein isoform X1 [Silurus asotus]|uniref:ATR-interacting protein isoform X1 n=1 Tax=Silurus asotus TaxID=30991 RepID=A0AAD5F989_SILAS|nr:ATR-interacting protein isoform X1 [Silurus asotus]